MKSRASAKKRSAPPPPKSEPREKEPRIVGDVVLKPLDFAKPNGWNPNAMTDFDRASLKHGLQTDGWLKSQSLLVWGKDDKGITRNLIIDGEQRWTVATEIGFKKGPMVILDGLTEPQAKALTVKMDAKRGKFRDEPLGKLLREIQFELGAENLSLDLGIQDGQLMALLAEPEVVIPGPEPEVRMSDEPLGAGAGIPQSNVRMQQLFFDPAQHEEFTEIIRELAKVYATKNVTDTTLEAMRRARRAASDEG